MITEGKTITAQAIIIYHKMYPLESYITNSHFFYYILDISNRYQENKKTFSRKEGF